MDIRFERDNGVVTASLAGRFDSAVAEGAHTELSHLVEDTDHGFILDLQNVSFISSAGLRIILLIARQLDERSGKLVLCRLPQALREVFRVSGFDNIITIAASPEQAKGMM